MKRVLSLLFVLALALPLVAPTVAQDAKPYTILKSYNSITIVWNQDPTFFRMEFPGNNIRRSIHGTCGIWVGDAFYDINVVDPSSFDGGELSGAELLRAHMQHEVTTWQEEAKTEMPLTEISATDEKALWEIEWSKKARKAMKDRKLAASVVKNLYLSAVIGDRLIVLNRPLMKNEDENEAYAYLEGLAESMQVSEEEINVGRVQRELLRRQ